MTEEEVIQKIEAEAARRRAADRRHIETLSAQMAEGLDAWCTMRRRVSRAACAILLLTAPAAYAAILPPRELPPVVCNEPDGTDAVAACANEILKQP
ncbi:MAG: hypothetical protein IKC19_03970 [Bacteroidales bacterium]|nr:hypothetical protein [Bacteroidales bacterium]